MAATKKSTETTPKNIQALRQELFLLQAKKFAGELKETHKLRLLRKDIARALTAQAQ